MKIVVTFSGLDPSRLVERIDQRLSERRTTRSATIRRPRASNDADSSPPVQSPRPANRRPRRDRRS